MFSISPSKLHCYLECPRHYWWQYINPSTRGLQPLKPYFTMGSHVHTAISRFFKINPEFRTKDKLMNLLENQWRMCPGPAGGFWTPEIEDEYKQRAQLMLSGFFEREDMAAVPLWNSDNLVKAQVSPTLQFVGKLDRVDEEEGGLHVIDYKTSKEEREDEWQLAMYSVLASRHLNKPVVKLSYLFLEIGSWITNDANPAREQFTISKIQKIVNDMPKSEDRADWLCPDGDACGHCDYLKDFGLDPLGETVEAPRRTRVSAYPSSR